MGKSKVLLPKRLIIDVRAQRRAIDNALTAAAKGIKVDFGVTAQTWNDKPTFAISTPSPFEREISTDDPIYTMLNEGTRAHDIFPRPGGILRFQTPFRSKTIPREIRSRKGMIGKNEAWSRHGVHHPGTEAREWDAVIAQKWDRQLGVIFQRAIDAEL